MVRIFIKGGVWRNSEDEILKAAVMKYGLNNWSRVASLLVKKSAKQCKARWYEWLDPSVKKTEWTLEEEEKLLHLAKIMPSQWRTIAPIVGRTAYQCLMHYEELLDQAQDGTEGPAGTGYSQAPGSRKAPGRGVGFLRGKEDPRRLRPGEIDPHPETKPSRADPIDMAEDEKEMLEEARARLANTRGKKAKRKAREKQLEEARRLAALQKKRELKAAGIITGARRRTRKNFQPYEEVPFEEKPPPGFYEVPPEENPAGNLNFANISLQHMEGTMRAREEEKLRREDARKLKRLREDHLDEYLKLQEEKLKREAIAKKIKLNLPEPMLKEHELEELVRLGAEASLLTGSDGHDETSTLLAQGLSTPSTAISRVPRRSERVQQEAKNALALLGVNTPLEGEENAQIEEVPGGSGLTPLNVRTPNALQQQLRGSRLTGAISDTPLSAATRITGTGLGSNATPLQDPSDGGSASEGGGMGSRAELQLARLHARTSLASLPAPRNDVTGQIPDDITEEEKELLESEADLDMEEVERRRAERAAQAARRRFLEQTQVMQMELPRPILPPLKPLSLAVDASSLIATAVQQQLQEDEKTRISEEAKDAAVAAVSEANAMTERVMSLLVQHDCYQHPFRGVKPPPPTGELPPCSLEEMQAARELVELELASWGVDENFPKLDKLLFTLETQLVYTPTTKSYVVASNLSASERLQVYTHQVESLKNSLVNAVQRTKKLEKKYKVLTAGYANRQKELAKSINENSAELVQLEARVASFGKLHEAERQAVKTRTEEKRQEVIRERAKHLYLQKSGVSLFVHFLCCPVRVSATVCPSLYEPVCGSDGRTYGNSCMARKAKVSIASTGSCSGSSGSSSGSSCSCSLDYSPVCDTKGRTHQNSCTLKCAGASLAYAGACPCSCPTEYNPVCDTNSHTFHNECLLKCKGATVAYQGACPLRSACTCIDHRDPMCDINGKTHLNECVMKCKGGVLASRGVCRASSPTRCNCPSSYNPVCDTEGKTHNNACMLRCKGATLASEGACTSDSTSQSCSCPKTVDPVCDTNGITHRNACVMNCRGGTLAKKGACPSRRGCSCPNSYKPVCDTQGKTYFNKCLLECKEATFAYEGRCNSKKI
ncbi:hypothetical protein Efla_004300 [Eimeria flavescens]